jgi:sugar/nucleoside kinase (ribokinase family)
VTLLVTGWVALDDIETPFGSVRGSLGGSATCAALAASLFTGVRLVAAVGEDFPASERAKLHRPNIDLAGLVTLPGETSRWGARYDYDMNSRETLFTHLGVNAAFEPSLPPGWEGSETAFLAAGAPALQRRFIESLAGPRLTMVDTIRLFIENDLDELLRTMAAAHMVTLNDSELRQIRRTASVAKAARELLALGTGGVVIKLGEYGAIFMSKNDYFVAPGYPLEEVVDPTGAGDAFAGGFLGHLDTVPEITPAEVRRAMIYGSAVASFQVEGLGPERLLNLTRTEVDIRYAAFRQLTHFEAGE